MVVAFVLPFLGVSTWACLLLMLAFSLRWFITRQWRHVFIISLLFVGLCYNGYTVHSYQVSLQKALLLSQFNVIVVDYCLDRFQTRFLIKDCDTGYNYWLKTKKKLHYGDVLDVEGRFFEPNQGTNPGQFDERSFSYVKHRLGTIRPSSVKIVGKKAFRFKSSVIALKQHVLQTFRQWMKEPYADFFVGLVYGQHGTRLPADLLLMFKNLGLTHLLVVSGTQVSLISGVVYCMVRQVVSRSIYVFLCIVVANVFFYMLTGGGASIVRSCVMNCAVVLGSAFHFRFSSSHVLVLTAFLMLLIDPLLIMDIGFQLSFLATLSLVFGMRFVESKTTVFSRYFGGQIALVSLLPFIFTLPVLVVHFSLFNPLSILANCLFVPLVEPLVAIGFLFTFISFFTPVIQYAFKGLEGFLSVYLSLLTLIQPYLTFPVNLKSTLFHSNQLEITFLDIGQGDSTVIETPSGYTVLVDTGTISRGKNNVRQVIQPFLTYKGYTLDALIISHYDKDHCAGVDALLSLYPNLSIIDNGFAKQAYSSHKRIQNPLSLTIKDGVEFHFLYPNRDVESETKNNRSVVFKLVYKQFEALFTGDLEKSGELELATHYGDYLDSDVYQVGHHGSKTSSTQPLLTVLTPEVSIVSSGRRNRYGHPHATVVERLINYGVVYQTNMHGAVTVKTNGVGYEVDSFLRAP